MGPVTFSGKPTQPVLFGSTAPVEVVPDKKRETVECSVASHEAVEDIAVVPELAEPVKPVKPVKVPSESVRFKQHCLEKELRLADKRKRHSEMMKKHWAERKQREISRPVLPVSR